MFLKMLYCSLQIDPKRQHAVEHFGISVHDWRPVFKVPTQPFKKISSDFLDMFHNPFRPVVLRPIFARGEFLSERDFHCKNIFLCALKPPTLQRYAMRRRRLEFSDAFALVLQRTREERKLSKQVLAEKAGLHQTYIGKIESGSSNPSLDAANAIAEALGVPLSKLIIETETERRQGDSASRLR